MKNDQILEIQFTNAISEPFVEIFNTSLGNICKLDDRQQKF